MHGSCRVQLNFHSTLGFVLTLLLTACGAEEKDNKVFKSTKPACESSALNNQFIVKWKSGRLSVEHSQNKATFLQEFVEKNKDKIEYAEHDYYVFVDPIRSASISDDEPDDDWGTKLIGAPSVWDQGFKGDGVVVAVTDTGLDVSHPLIKDQIAYNPGEDGLDAEGRDKRTNGVDDDNNGYIDDYAGYDVITQSGVTEDYASHGTHVSGIIAAAHDSSSTMKSVAPEAKIIPIAFLGASGGGTTGAAIEALQYAQDREVDVVNASWGGAPCSVALREKISALVTAGVLFVAAAGNRSNNIDLLDEYPASYALPGQVTVGSVGFIQYFKARHSNYGEASVHLFAPGMEILSTVPGGMESLSGTSMAAPFVSGAAALLLSMNSELSPGDLKELLMSSVDVNETYRNASRGRLNVAKAAALQLTHP